MNNSLAVEVTARLTVSDEMADRCLVLLEWWQKDHAEQRILGTNNADGSVHFYREPVNDETTGNRLSEE